MRVSETVEGGEVNKAVGGLDSLDKELDSSVGLSDSNCEGLSKGDTTRCQDRAWEGLPEISLEGELDGDVLLSSKGEPDELALCRNEGKAGEGLFECWMDGTYDRVMDSKTMGDCNRRTLGTLDGRRLDATDGAEDIPMEGLFDSTTEGLDDKASNR